MKLSDLMQYLDTAKFWQRENGDVDFDNLIVYHLTSPANIEDIKNCGIKARSSQQSYDRPAAVYFFAGKEDITQANVEILGLADGYNIIRVKIPAEKVLENMVWDGLYNVSFETSSTAVQYFDDVPAEWIVSYDYKI